MQKVCFFCICLSLMILGSLVGYGQQKANPNLLGPRVRMVASSVNRDYPLRRLYDPRPQTRWETFAGKEGSWLDVEWDSIQTISELWIINKPAPFDMLLDLDLRTADFPAARTITLDFSDGSSIKAELQLTDHFQIIQLPEIKRVQGFRLTINSLWGNSAKQHTGLGKLSVYGDYHQPSFTLHCCEMYDVQTLKPVKSAVIRIVNPGKTLVGAKLVMYRGRKTFAELPLDTIPAQSVTQQQLWVPSVYETTILKCSIIDLKGDATVFPPYVVTLTPYRKDYFDGGTFHILSTGHNDLGFQDTQAKTALYRSNEQIGPALDLMRDYPEYRYYMESVEYLKEFISLYPQRREEMAQRLAEGRFSVGANYVQNLQSHVGQEKIVREFYLGRRWLRENFPGCDTRFVSNVDVPAMTFQYPQILKKAGIDYLIQGRMPWGFYHWEGRDGTRLPVFALRYTNSSKLLNPKNNSGWIHFQSIREQYYRKFSLPKALVYDFNCDYLPPEPAMIPFVASQNSSMKAFADDWNRHFSDIPERRINPPTLRFSSPKEALDVFFAHDTLQIDTLKGEWPLSWAYYDEPGHREALLNGRKGHNSLLRAEQMNLWLSTLSSAYKYPKEALEEGWKAVCWPDHGWGGNHGVTSDSVNEASYMNAARIGAELTAQAGLNLATVAGKRLGRIPIMVYNAVGWPRSDVVIGNIDYPRSWTGISIVDGAGKPVPCELTSRNATAHQAKIAFYAQNVPPLGYRIYYLQESARFTGAPVHLTQSDVLENEYIKVRLSASGITSLFDKITNREVLNTTKFSGAELLRFAAPMPAWEGLASVTTDGFDRTANHHLSTISATKSPVRYVVLKEAMFPEFTLRQRFILNKHARELIVETELLDWDGVPNVEFRMAFPMNAAPGANVCYDAPFGAVEKGRDEVDFSHIHATVEDQFNPTFDARRDLPFREALNWVDVSQEIGCLVASDITLHLFDDQSANPVGYPLVQHVLLSTRKSLAWNPDNWFIQPGSHSFRTALYPHEGGWRNAYRQGLAFNQPLSLHCGMAYEGTGNPTSPATGSFLKVAPSNIVVSALKAAEDGNGWIVRLYEAEGRPAQLRLTGVKPFAAAWLTDIIEYDQKELAVEADGSLQMPLKPWEIVTLRIKF